MSNEHDQTYLRAIVRRLAMTTQGSETIPHRGLELENEGVGI